jgi:hypothetical protein
MTVNGVNFTGTTKYGNHYEKTSAGKATCATLLLAGGVGAGAYGVAKTMGENDKFFKSVADNFTKLGEKALPVKTSIANKLKDVPLLKNISKIGAKGTAGIIIGAAALALIGAGTIIGSLIDGCVNAGRKSAADKA